MNGLQRGTLTEMNPEFMDYIWDNFFNSWNGSSRGTAIEGDTGSSR